MEVRLDFGNLRSPMFWCRLSLVLKVCVLSSFLYASNCTAFTFSERRLDAQRTEVAKAPVHPMTAICTAVIIINKWLHKFQQMKSCYFILSALFLLCAAKLPVCHLFWLIFVEMRFKEEPNYSIWEHSCPLCQHVLSLSEIKKIKIKIKPKIRIANRLT